MAVVNTYNFLSGNIPITVSIENEKDEFILVYKVSISKISPNTEIILEKIRDELVEKVKLGVADITDPKKVEYIRNKFKATIIYLLDKYLPDITEETKNFLTTYLMQKSFGLGKVEILISDSNLEEVVINNAEEPVWVYHHKLGWLKTNIYLKDEELVKHYSSLIGRKVGRSITLLTPLLDAHLETGDRVNATLYPISTKGNTITIRKFATKTITIVDMIKDKVISIPSASLIWDAIHYESSCLVTGGTATGKTSFLGAVCSFFPPNQRIISVEDSVSGDSKMLYGENGRIRKTEIGKLIDSKLEKDKLILLDGTEICENKYDTKVFSMDKNGKIKLNKIGSFIRHKTNKKLLEITLATGRKIKITEDHSLFGLINNKIKEVKCSELKKGHFIAVPRILNYSGSEKIFDLTEYLDFFNDFMIKGEPVKRLIIEHGKEITDNKSNRQHYREKRIIPVRLFKKFLNHINKNDKTKLILVPKRHSEVKIPLIVKIDELFSLIIGMWLADGCYDKRSVLLSDPEKECIDKIQKFANKFGAENKLHSDKVTTIINSKVLKVLFEDVLELKGDAYTKKIPEWIFNLNYNCVANLLKGYFSGDGTVKKNEISINSCSIKLLEDVQTLLLRFEIPLKMSRKIRKDRSYEARISGSKFIIHFNEEIGFLQYYKNNRLRNFNNRKMHDISDVIPLDKKSYRPLKYSLGKKFRECLSKKSWKSWQRKYILGSNIGRGTLQKLIALGSISIVIPDFNLSEIMEIKNLAENDIFWDKISDIKEIEFNGYVYDLSVPENESFVCENIIAHNTREIQLPKYLHWVPLVTRQANVEGKGEITMLDLILNSLRMRPDRIVVGEIRRKQEAETLFEAMHTGHSVYATLHANDTEETINRLTNPPIDVPKVLLPAISLIIVMYRNRRTGIRRIFQISEVLRNSSYNVLLQLDMKQDKVSAINKSQRLFPELELVTGLSRQELDESLREKGQILKWLVQNNINTVDEIGKVVATYYTNKENLLKFIIKKNV